LRGEVRFDDFGPWLHEAVDFDIDYDISPNIDSNLFLSNDGKVHTVLHRRDPFGSRLVIANKARGPVVVVGEDAEQDRSMSMFIYGLPIIQDEARNVSRQDEQSVKRRGAKELEVESIWIQTQAQAERIADWVVDRWGKPSDTIDVEIVMDPRVQIGDLAAISDTRKGMDESNHKYFVIGIRKTFGTDPSMQLTLRRAWL
jgi:hypothetical protein